MKGVVDFLGGPVVKNLPVNAADHGFDPWSGKFPHVKDSLACAPQLLKSTPYCLGSATRGATAVRSLLTAARE